jgi:tetratricopeptide (TPR) repeat protein
MVERSKLRELAHLPHCPITFQFESLSSACLGLPNRGVHDLNQRIAMLEKGVTGDSRDAAKCLELAKLHYVRMYVALFGGADRVPWEDRDQPLHLLQNLLVNPPAPEQIREAQQCLDAALKCFDRAVAIAPEQVEAYQCRSACQLQALLWRQGFSILQHQPAADVGKEFLSTDLLHDARQLVRLRPDDTAFLGNLAQIYVWSAWASNGNPEGRPGTTMSLVRGQDLRKASPTAQRGLQQTLAKLRLLSMDPDPAVAAAACRHLGRCDLLMGAVRKAEPQAARAIALQPTCQENWDLLLVCKWARFEPWQAYQVCKKQLRYLPTPVNYLRLAGVYAGVEIFDKAAKVLRAAVKKHPDDIACRIGLAAMLLRDNDRPKTLATAKHCLARAEILAGKKCNKNQGQEVRFHLAIHLALTGGLEESREAFQAAYANDPNNEWAAKALALFWDDDQNGRSRACGEKVKAPAADIPHSLTHSPESDTPSCPPSRTASSAVARRTQGW